MKKFLFLTVFTLSLASCGNKANKEEVKENDSVEVVIDSIEIEENVDTLLTDSIKI